MNQQEEEEFIETLEKSGVLAFCPRCGSQKSGYRKRCNSCGLDPRNTDKDLARGILMSTEQYYMRSKDWEDRTPEENTKFIKREIVPKLIDNATTLRSGKELVFGFEEESYWVKRIKSDKQQKPPISLGFFLIVLYSLVAAIVFFFIKVVLFNK